MNTRRSLIAGGICALAAGAAFALEPRRHVSLLQGRSLALLVPSAFGAYRSHDVSDLVAPRDDDSLAARLYGETIGRVYRLDQAGAFDIMMLLAYGSTQNDALQLHRPEICYPFSGYVVSDLHTLPVPLQANVAIPCQTLVATAEEQHETIIYWSRVGDFLPLSHSQQTMDRWILAAHGEIADGVLARFSVANQDPQASRDAILSFISALIWAMTPSARTALIGPTRSKLLASQPT